MKPLIYDSYCRGDISIRILGDKYVVCSKTFVVDILERELRCTENVVDKQALSFSQSVPLYQRSTLTFTHITQTLYFPFTNLHRR